jgi:hypothetical protein
MTLDSDLFAMGGEHIWRLLRIRKEWIVEDIYVEKVCDNEGISLNMLQDACFLAGWDRCHLTGTSYMPFDIALNRIKYYGNLNAVLEKFKKELSETEEGPMERLKNLKRESRVRWVKILEERK